MGFLQSLFRKKEGSCCNVNIVEVEESKESCCTSANESVKDEDKNNKNSCCE